MFMTMRVCLIILTAVAVICALALTVAIVLYLYKSRHALMRFRQSSDDLSVSGTPLIAHATKAPSLYIANKRPPPPIPLPKQLANGTTTVISSAESA